MERDFLGIHSKIFHPDAAKGDPRGIRQDADCSCFPPLAPPEGILAGPPQLQWPFSNKASAMQQFMLYKASREERPRNHVLPKHPSLRSQPFLNVTVIEPNQMANPVLPPQNFFVRHSVHGSSGPSSRQLNVHHTVPLAGKNPYFKAHNSAATSSFKLTEKQAFLRGAEVGSFGHRNMAKKNHRPAQLTIFYGGCVNVFDDVPLDKAQSVMSSLANRGPNEASNLKKMRSEASVRAVSPSSALSTRISTVPTCSKINNAMTGFKLVVPPISVIQQEATPRAIPQARKASLARFLEKRKERLTSAMPYSSTKISSENDSVYNVSSTSNSSVDTDLWRHHRKASSFLKNNKESISTKLTI